MPSAQGYIKFANSRLVGTFDVDGSPRYLSVEVKALNQPFECGNATLTYRSIEQLVGNCKWMGTAGTDDLQMFLGPGITIAGPLVTAWSASLSIRGAGTWDTVEGTFSPQNNVSNVLANPSSSNDVVKDPAKAARVKQLLESDTPIIA